MSHYRIPHHRISARKIVVLLIAAAALWFAATAATAASIRITSPANEETIHDNSGNVSIELQADLGGKQRVRLLLDGKPTMPDGVRTSINLQGIERGEHTLEAMVLDEDGSTAAASGPVTFFMWQASTNLPPRNPKPAPSPPKK